MVVIRQGHESGHSQRFLVVDWVCIRDKNRRGVSCVLLPSSIGPGLIPEKDIHGGRRHPENSSGLDRLWCVGSHNFLLRLSFCSGNFDRFVSYSVVVIELLLSENPVLCVK